MELPEKTELFIYSPQNPLPDNFKKAVCKDTKTGRPYLKTQNGIYFLKTGDMLCRTESGEFYVDKS